MDGLGVGWGGIAWHLTVTVWCEQVGGMSVPGRKTGKNKIGGKSGDQQVCVDEAESDRATKRRGDAHRQGDVSV